MSVTYRNPTGSPINVEWCVEPTHWLTEIHDAPVIGDPGAQADAFQTDAFQMETTLPDVTASSSVDAGVLITIDELEADGPAIVALFVASGLELA